METGINITEATPGDATELAAIHIAARRDAMSYLPARHSDEETLEWFITRLADAPTSFRVARTEQQIVGYFALYEFDLDDLYVRPGHQGRGVGSALLEEAKSLNSQRLALATFQQNVRAQAFYEARGFLEVGRTDGDNQEGLPDIRYERSGP